MMKCVRGVKVPCNLRVAEKIKYARIVLDTICQAWWETDDGLGYSSGRFKHD